MINYDIVNTKEKFSKNRSAYSTSIATNSILGALGVSVALLAPTQHVEATRYLPDSYKESLLMRQLYLKEDQTYSKDTRQPKKSIKNNTHILSAQDIVVEFRDQGMPISAIASMARVERKTVYSWINGASIKPENEDRISNIYRHLKKNKVASFGSLYRYINKNVDNNTLAKALSVEDIDFSSVTNLAGQIWPLAEKIEQVQRPKISSDVKSNPVMDDMTEVYFS